MKIKHYNIELNRTFILNNNMNHKSYDLCILKTSVDN